jgi:hypothetical protein
MYFCICRNPTDRKPTGREEVSGKLTAACLIAPSALD